MSANQRQATTLLSDFVSGDSAAADQLLPLVYDELRALARGLLRRERADHSLQPTALVHEAYLRLIDVRKTDWRDRAHFFRFAALIMRRVLVDHAKHRNAAKRIGGHGRVTLDENLAVGNCADVSIIDLDTALSRLSAQNERRAEIASMHILSGLSAAEIAEVLGVSKRTVEREWRVARAWLIVELWGTSNRESPDVA